MNEPGAYFAARRWPILLAVKFALSLILGIYFLSRGAVWAAAFGAGLLCAAPFQLLMARSYLLVPLIVIGPDTIALRRGASKRSKVVRLSEIGPLEWRTGAAACFRLGEHGSITVRLLELSKQSRSEVLRRLGVEQAL